MFELNHESERSRPATTGGDQQRPATTQQADFSDLVFLYSFSMRNGEVVAAFSTEAHG